MIIRLSRARLDPVSYDACVGILSDRDHGLRAALAQLPGLLSYHVAVDRDSSTMVNISHWDTHEHAQAMATLPEMLAWRAAFEPLGAVFDPIVNYVALWSV